MKIAGVWSGHDCSFCVLEDGKPLDTRAVSGAQGPGTLMMFVPFDLTALIKSSPGSQIPGMPASLTSAIDSPEFRSLIILGILLKELSLLKLVTLFEN